MKKCMLLFAGMLMCWQVVLSQRPDYRVVFDMSTRDSVSQLAVIREANLIKSSNPDAKIEVVIYGQALGMVLKNKSSQADAIQKLLTNNDVSFKVCAFTLQRNNVDKSQLLQGIDVVPDGIYEIITKQREGWGYIKVAH